MRHNIHDVGDLEKMVNDLGFQGSLKEFSKATILFLVDQDQKNVAGVYSLVIHIRGLAFRDLTFSSSVEELEIFACVDTPLVNMQVTEDDDEVVWFSFLEISGKKGDVKGILFTGDQLCSISGKILFL